MKTYQFWSKTKNNNRETWTELKAASKEAVKEWAKKNKVEITSSITTKDSSERV